MRLLLLAAALAIGAAGLLVHPDLRATALESRPPGPADSLRRVPDPYRTEVIRIVDGDTFEAWVTIWPNQVIRTFVRLRDVDTPELRSPCATEQALALKAHTTLTALLAGGAVTLHDVGPDAFGGRVDARVMVSGTVDVGETLAQRGLAVRWGDGWGCGGG